MDERRQRAWQALELGPLWRLRGVPAAGAHAAPEDDEAPAAALPPQRFPAPGLEPGSPAVHDPLLRAAASMRPDPAPSPGPPHPEDAPGLSRPPAGAQVEVASSGWPELRAAVQSCRACSLSEGRNRTVFGVGPQEARWLVIGEGPGAEEDASGEPFVGQAGRLLDAMLAAIGLDRQRNVFIANVVKCRPPGNRNPLPEEIACCLPFLRRQVELLAPQFVLLLGRVAAHAMLGTEASVGSLRGQVHRLRVGALDVPAVVTWHPSYLLRRPEEKALAWADLCLAQEHFEAAGRAERGD